MPSPWLPYLTAVVPLGLVPMKLPTIELLTDGVTTGMPIPPPKPETPMPEDAVPSMTLLRMTLLFDPTPMPPDELDCPKLLFERTCPVVGSPKKPIQLFWIKFPFEP